MFVNHCACRCVVSALRKFSTNQRNSQKSSKSHYTALGITPKATQADVKAAYYRLSKQYHPDTQKGENDDDTTLKFREVTAAYEVLGNVKLRRLYDKGMHHSGSVDAPRAWAPPNAAEDDDPSLKFYRSREVRSKPPAPAGGTPVYDFDAWAKQHYGTRFRKDKIIRDRQRERQAFHAKADNEVRVEKVLIALAVVLAVCMILAADAQDYDKVTYEKEYRAQKR